MILIVAGVSGSGKTPVGALLAGRLGWRVADADAFHPAANIAKMQAGIPLTDADRRPWLRAVTAWMDEHIARGEPAVVTCSGLKRAYREAVLDGRAPAGPDDLPEHRSRGGGPAAGRPARSLLPSGLARQPVRRARTAAARRGRGHRRAGRAGPWAGGGGSHC